MPTIIFAQIFATDMAIDRQPNATEELSTAHEPQLELFEPALKPTTLAVFDKKNGKDVWDKSIRVEENSYCWKKDPVFTK